MSKKTYMVAVSKTIKLTATCYQEVIAESAAEAVELAKDQENSSDDSIANESWSDEFKIQLDETPIRDLTSPKSVFKSVGPASQYHSSSECKLCKQVERANRKEAI